MAGFISVFCFYSAGLSCAFWRLYFDYWSFVELFWIGDSSDLIILFHPILAIPGAWKHLQPHFYQPFSRFATYLVSHVRAVALVQWSHSLLICALGIRCSGAGAVAWLVHYSANTDRAGFSPIAQAHSAYCSPALGAVKVGVEGQTKLHRVTG